MKADNLKELFEGDRVKTMFSDLLNPTYKYGVASYPRMESIEVVSYSEKWAMFIITRQQEFGDFEIIGNVHEVKR